MKVIIDLNLFYSEDVRLVKSVLKRESDEEFPELLKWKLQMLYFDGSKWQEISRIDNYFHEGKQGCHIHKYGIAYVVWKDMDIEGAEKIIKKIGSRILLDKFNKKMEFD